MATERVDAFQVAQVKNSAVLLRRVANDRRFSGKMGAGKIDQIEPQQSLRTLVPEVLIGGIVRVHEEMAVRLVVEW